MKENQESRDFLIRNIPLEIYLLLEQEAKEHNRSKNKEAIIALSNGLKISGHRVQKPKPFRWKKKLTNKFIHDAINEGRKILF